MRAPPPSVLASWPDPNYVNPVTRGNANLIVNLVLYPLAMIFLFLRIYARARITKSFGLDDVFIIIAAVPASGFFALALLVDVHYNLFRHTWDISLPDLTRQLQFNIAAECLFAFSFLFTKLSILQLVWRILERSTTKSRLIILAAMIVIAGEFVGFILTVIFQCTPISAYWTISSAPQNCISEKTNLLVAGIFNTVTDILVVVLPIILIWKMKLPVRQLALVSSLFGLGFIVVVAGVFRTVMFYHLGDSYDKTWVAYYVWMPTSIELYTGILCASIPPTQPFLVKLFPKLSAHFHPQPKHSSHSPILPHINPLQQHPFSQTALINEKPASETPQRRNSGITVEDEILISFQSADKFSDAQGQSFLDLDSFDTGPMVPAKDRSGSRSNGGGQAQRSANDMRPGTYRKHIIEPRHNMPPRVQYFKSPKLVRIDINKPRIRTITPDSEWGGSNENRSFRGSWTSVSSPNSSPPKRKKHRRGQTTRRNSKSNIIIDTGVSRKAYRKTSTASSSGVTNSSRIIGVSIDESRIELPSPSGAVFHLKTPPSHHRSPSSHQSPTRHQIPSRQGSPTRTINRPSGSSSNQVLKSPARPPPTPNYQRNYSNEVIKSVSRGSSFDRTPLTSPIPAAAFHHFNKNTTRSPTSIPIKTLSSPRSMDNLSSPKTNHFGPLTSPSRSMTLTSTHYTGTLPSPSRSLNLLSNSTRTPPLPMRFGLGNSSLKSNPSTNMPESNHTSLSPENSLIDSLRTSEIPSLSAIQRVAIMGRARGSLVSGIGSDSDKEFPLPTGFRNFGMGNVGGAARVDSQALSFRSAQDLLDSIRQGYT